MPTLASTKPALKSALPSQHTRKLSTKIEKQASHASEGGKEASSADSGSDLTSQQPKRTTKKATGKPTGPRREQSDLFKAFAKPKAKLNRDDTGSSVGDLPAPPVAQLVRVYVSATVDFVLTSSSLESQVYLRMVWTTRIPRLNEANLCRTDARCLGRRTRGRFHRQHGSSGKVQQKVQSRARRTAEEYDGTRRNVSIPIL